MMLFVDCYSRNYKANDVKKKYYTFYKCIWIFLLYAINNVIKCNVKYIK